MNKKALRIIRGCMYRRNKRNKEEKIRGTPIGVPLKK